MALPAAYAVGMGVKLVILALALAPRMERIGRPVETPGLGSRRYAPARLADPEEFGAARIPDRNRMPKLALGIGVAACLTVAGLYTATQALQGASFGYAPITPKPRVQATEQLVDPTSAPSAIAAATGS